jgi:nucleotide-binding universal stress UspA family protein
VTERIVVGVDGTASSLDAVRWSAHEAARRQVPLRLVHAYWVPGHDFPELELTDEDVRAEMRRFGSDLLTRATRVAVETERAVGVETELRAGDPRVVLLDECRHAGLAVLGSRQLSAAGGLLVGSIGLTLAVQGRCPLVVVRGVPVERGPVLVGSDGSPAAEVALGFAFTEADLTGATLTVVRTWDGIPTDAAARHEHERRALDERLSPWRARFPGVTVDPVVVRGRPGAVLLEYARHARLIVVGSRGHGEVTGLLLGSTSQRLARRSPCPLAIVRADMRVAGPLRESPGSRAR